MRGKSDALSNNLIATGRLVIVLVGVIVASSVSAQDYSVVTEKRVKFLDTSFQRLDGKISPQNMTYVSGKVTLWKETKGERDWINVTDAVYNAASYGEIRSEVEISASGGTGASVKYQTLGERKRGKSPTTGKGLTTTTERMSIGIYYIWTERNGKVTANKDAQFEITGVKEIVLLEESK